MAVGSLRIELTPNFDDVAAKVNLQTARKLKKAAKVKPINGHLSRRHADTHTRRWENAPNERASRELWDVHSFYSGWISRFLQIRQELRKIGRIPLEYLPIVNDYFDNIICLMVKGPDTGKVYFWDHEANDDAAFLELAPDIDGFLGTFFD